LRTTVITRSSEWTFDDEDKTYTRKPVNAGYDHPFVAYTDEPREYVEALIPESEGALVVLHGDGTRLSSWAREVIRGAG
jgi:hypothetical protein